MYWSALFTKMFSVHYLAGSLNPPSPLSGSLRRCPPNLVTALIARFMGPTWGPSGADRTQMGPMLAPWTLLSERDYSGFRGVSRSSFTSLYGSGPYPIRNWPWQKKVIGPRPSGQCWWPWLCYQNEQLIFIQIMLHVDIACFIRSFIVFSFSQSVIDVTSYLRFCLKKNPYHVLLKQKWLHFVYNWFRHCLWFWISVPLSATNRDVWKNLFLFGVICCMLSTFLVSSRIVANISQSSLLSIALLSSLEENVAKKLLSLPVDLFFKILLFGVAFLIFCDILLFLLTFYSLVCYCSVLFCFSQRTNQILYFINWYRFAASNDWPSLFVFWFYQFFLRLIVTCRLWIIYMREDNDSSVLDMITWLIWITWTLMSIVWESL